MIDVLRESRNAHGGFIHAPERLKSAVPSTRTRQAMRGLSYWGKRMSEYEEFLAKKAQDGMMEGFMPNFMPDYLFDFQRALVDWGLRKGKSAMFVDTGMGKTPMQLVWAENVVRHTNKPVLVLTPLAVASQTIRESEKFGIEATREVGKHIVVVNYERLHHYDTLDYGGVVCDESSAIKCFEGAHRKEITEFMRQVPYRLLCTATAAPNDYTELGTSSEALGNLGYTDMLGRFFVNDQHSISVSHNHGVWDRGWRFKGHAETPFWRWVCSWARALRKPSDFGYDDGLFILPPLIEQETIVAARKPRADMLFDIPAVGFREEREVRRRTIEERCEVAALKVLGTGKAAVIWCHLNDEADTVTKMIPGAQQVSGQDSDESKEEKFEAFRTGVLRVLVIKPVIGAWGLNWQHCAHVVYFVSHSYEQFYQAVRRCWRFGQTQSVTVDMIRTEAEERVMANLKRKAQAADRMFTDLVGYMNNALVIDRRREFTGKGEVPKWL